MESRLSNKGRKFFHDAINVSKGVKYNERQRMAVWPVRDCGATFLSTETKD